MTTVMRITIDIRISIGITTIMTKGIRIIIGTRGIRMKITTKIRTSI
jgi:hypothetical protein